MDARSALSDQEGSLATQCHVVLVVDDEPDILDSIKTFLEGTIDNIHIETATSGPRALDYVRENAVDLILTDYRMPGMNGLEFLERAKEHQAEIPRIIITAYPDLEIAIQAINDERVEAFFPKPLDPTHLAETTTELLGRRRRQAMRERAYERAMTLLERRKGLDPSDGRAAVS